MEITLGSVIALAATTGIFTALLNQLLTVLREWWVSSSNKRARAGYHALRLAVLLEAYAEACADLIIENDNLEPPSPEQEFPDWNLKLPDLPSYPDDAEGWRAIDLQLAARALNLRNRISGSQGIIFANREHTPEELGRVTDEEAAERGLEAWEIAVALRRKHGLDPIGPIWDFIGRLERSQKEVKELTAGQGGSNGG